MSLPPVALVSLGCPKNLVDAEVMLGLLERAGYPLVEDPEQAEVLLVNTCAFIEPAVEEAVDALLELAGKEVVRTRWEPALHRLADDADALIREHARWALARLAA